MPMYFSEKLRLAGERNHSMLCVGLDPVPERLPAGIVRDVGGIARFCRAIVDATHDQVIAFKPQIACFAAVGAESALEEVIAHIRDVAPHIPVILDAKRGDIGSTAQHYAKEAFERYDADAVTLSPYMGFDTVQPYLAYRDRGVFLLCRTSNPGGSDLQAQRLQSAEGNPLLYEYIATLTDTVWSEQAADSGQIGLVVGATWPAELRRVRQLAPRTPLLIPGIGAQGGDARATVQAAYTGAGSAVVSSSRAILYAGSGADFAQCARTEADKTRSILQAAAGDRTTDSTAGSTAGSANG